MKNDFEIVKDDKKSFKKKQSIKQNSEKEAKKNVH
jgi:hypothetical protein